MNYSIDDYEKKILKPNKKNYIVLMFVVIFSLFWLYYGTGY